MKTKKVLFTDLIGFRGIAVFLLFSTALFFLLFPFTLYQQNEQKAFAELSSVQGKKPESFHVMPEQVAVQMPYAYLTMGVQLMVIDVASPAHPLLRGALGVPGVILDVAVQGDYVYLATKQGLFIINASNPQTPTLVSFYPGYFRKVVIGGDYLYLINGTSDITILDVSDRSHPTVAAQLDKDNYTYTYASGLAVDDSYLYITYMLGYMGGLEIVQISDPRNPFSVGNYEVGYPYEVAVAGDYAYLGISGTDYPRLPGRLRIVNVSDPSAPYLVGQESIWTGPGRMLLSLYAGHYVYTHMSSRLQITDISDPALPVMAGAQYYLDAKDMALAWPYLYLAYEGLWIWDVGDLDNLVEVGNFVPVQYPAFLPLILKTE